MQNWETRVSGAHLHPRMEFRAESLVLGVGTVLIKMGRDARNRPRLALDDALRVAAQLATCYERPVSPYVLQKIRRAAELWSSGEKALAHIHLAYANLPRCDEGQALRLFVADELLEAGVAPKTLMKAQGLDPTTRDLSKANFNPAELRVLAGNGRESGEWSGGGATIIPVAGGPHENEKERIYEERRAKGEESPKEDIEHGRPIPIAPEGALAPPSAGAVNPEPLPKVDLNKLHHIFDKQGRELDEFLSNYDSQETAYQAIEAATRNAIGELKLTGQYKLQIELNGQKLGVGGKVMDDGTIKIGTAYPWKD